MRHGGSRRILQPAGTTYEPLRPLCPLWVKSGHESLKPRCPLYPRKRTFAHWIRMSALGHKQTFCAGQKLALFDYLIGAGLKPLRHRQAKCLGDFQIDDELVFVRSPRRQRRPRRLGCGWMGQVRIARWKINRARQSVGALWCQFLHRKRRIAMDTGSDNLERDLLHRVD